MRIALLALLISGAAQAGVVAELLGDQSTLQLHDDAGPCVGAARWAVYLDAKQRIPGCWVLSPHGVQIAFLDGDVLIVPIEAFRKPKEL